MASPVRRLILAAHPGQALAAAFALLLGLALFIGLQRLVTPRYNWVTPLDQWIPFVAESWFLYVLFFPFVLLAAAYASPERFRGLGNATGLAFGVALLCFWLFPEVLPRPQLDALDNAFLQQRLSRMWQLDRACNGFPSLHVAVTCLAWWALRGRPYPWLSAAGGLLICLSTLTLKQHTLVDVAGGVLLALVCALVTQRQGNHRRVPA
ncbi:inositol phosphorylceramide synthase [Pseudomonas sp. TKO26]|uniref:phosphatase PAP2 family protein n=1 Tax=unclassified Pseudomonas TaxID=196821 RepID=UPI000D933DFF|nr:MULTISPECIES: phosphatase PAP2 family protein [unclassified Pseudomonas]PYY78183.1 inositol phosphorylceramide synthase [Pseudomonas sp. TKO30]PYY78683.1 inositol phosphorylceramide synthase [Pseudomonas sp. TKO29]PYY80592.1 inositol phosphorylceramide synthase [Pseudomonas sp. TKO26]PYY95466.1 inositol phosphorylceramide synthase [Pseudomonas sp. TKO14]